MIRSHSPEQTEEIGRKLGEHLFPGSVIELNGDLGAGKTHLVRGIALGLEVIDPALVTSPTFTLLQEYPARLPIYHFDAYRLASPEDFLDLGAEEYLAGDGVCLIEWGERVARHLPPDRLVITLTRKGEAEREILLDPLGEKHTPLAGCAEEHGDGPP